MNSKNVELNAAKEKLAKLIDHLYVLEREYDKALEHAASYLGYDEKIEKVRDERAREGANKQVISSQADSLIKISRIWADFFPANTSNQP
ncbi:hypothetical protein, partial [Klebsiella pneumoniae]|uniref:hypothetical protein n=1 Tax=Klebsiella pneumoniae TaxID=573 RepID=UPI0007D6F3D4